MRLSSLVVICVIGSVSAASLAQPPAPLTPKSLQAALAAKPEGTDADALAERIRAYFGGSEALMKGGAPKVDGLSVAWALEAPELAAIVPVRVVADVGSVILPMVKVGTTGVYAAVANL